MTDATTQGSKINDNNNNTVYYKHSTLGKPHVPITSTFSKDSTALLMLQYDIFQRVSSKDPFKMQNKCLRKIVSSGNNNFFKSILIVTKQRSLTQAVALPAGLQQDNNHVISKTNN